MMRHFLAEKKRRELKNKNQIFIRIDDLTRKNKQKENPILYIILVSLFIKQSKNSRIKNKLHPFFSLL